MPTQCLLFLVFGYYRTRLQVAAKSRWILWAFLASSTPCSFLLAAEVEIRLTASDIEGQPTVDIVESFRRTADGGLIATQWLSGMTLGEQPIFPVQNRGTLAPDAPDGVTTSPSAKSKLKEDADDLLGDIKKESGAGQEQKIRPIDLVDTLYVGKSFSLGRPVGPQRRRASSATVDVLKPALLQPSGVQISPDAKRIVIACYPVTITATIAGSMGASTTFVPQLSYAGRDLLGDTLYEHSPDLPLGDTSATSASDVDTLEGWLSATRGGQRPFRQLTIYLPASGTSKTSAYEVNGHQFQLGETGIKLLPAVGSALHTHIRSKGKFELQLVLPAPAKSQALRIPLLSNLGSGWRGPTETLVAVPAGATALTIPVNSPAGPGLILRPSLPIPLDQANRWHLVALLVGGKTASDSPTAYVLAIPVSAHVTDDKLNIRASAADVSGSVTLPPESKLVLQQPYPWSDNRSEVQHVITLKSTTPGEFSGLRGKVPAGGYLANWTIGEHVLPAVPLVVAGTSTKGAATLITYHNRCDYYRGEQVQAAVVVRAVQNLELANAKLTLWNGSAKTPFDIGTVSLTVPAGESRTLFITLPTDALPVGEHTLSLSATDAVCYPLRFTLYTPTPRTTFALYSWMTGSFSGPVRVGDRTAVNLLLDQKPTQFLRPDEVERFTTQGTVAQLFRGLLELDPLMPAAQKTEMYEAETEREMAVAMRLGLRFAPSYGWGLNSQEAAWNPKHSLPADLARMRRLCSLVAQRFRDFGNYAGLHLNWYPTYGGYWENHPATDGHAALRAEYLAKQVNEFKLPIIEREAKERRLRDIETGPQADLALAVERHKFRVGALPRAYEAWTERASQLMPGLTDKPLSSDVHQPGLSPTRPVYSSFLPISWFDQQTYYPSVYFSTLPAATIHAYTDYGFSPFQHLWGLDFWAAGVGDKPKWITTMSNGRDVMLPQALLAVARGADGIDINGDDPTATVVLSQFLTSYGPFFRELSPESDVAIITSLRQQILHGKLVGRWMGYTGGTYFDLYTKLWYARRPADVLLEEEVTPERLQKYRAVFLVNQQTPLPDIGTLALVKFERAGGKIFKDTTTSADFPGEVYKLEPGDSIGPQWEGDKYVATRDQMFVGVQAAYEATALELDKLLSQLPPSRATSDSHHTLLGTLTGKELAVVMAVNDTRTPPGIYHPWNFWSATVLASDGTLSFDKPYAVYDLFAGGSVLHPQPDGNGRFTLSISFDRAAARPLVLLPAAIKTIQVSVSTTSLNQGRPSGQAVELEVQIIDERGHALADACPLEITVLSEDRSIQEQFYRAAKQGEPISVRLPSQTEAGLWRIRVQELLSGRAVEAKIAVESAKILSAVVAPVLMPRPSDVQEFLQATQAPKDPAAQIVILLDGYQVQQQSELLALAEDLAEQLKSQQHAVRVHVIDPLEIAEVPQRWQPTALDQQYLAEMTSGKRVLRAEPLSTKYYQGERNRNEPDWLHPESGYGEPSAAYRMGTHVILLGTTASNRYLADLHQTVGMNPTKGLLSPGNAVVQVVWDAFIPGRNALCIEAIDVAGLKQGIDSTLLLSQTAPLDTSIAASSDLPRKVLDVLKSDGMQALPRYLNEFGASVSPIAFTPAGGVLVSANLQAENYFRFDAEGKLQQKWLGKYGLAPAASGDTLWTSQWWGAPAYIDKVVRCDANAQPQWMMDTPRFSRSFQYWQHPGVATLPDRASDDLFVAGHCRLARLSSAGKTIWAYDDAATAHDVQAFRFRRDLMLHDVSSDGKLLLVAAFGIEPYSNFVSEFVRPALMLFEAETGKLLWEQSDILVDHTPCSFTSDETTNILVGDESPNHRRLLLLDEKGQELWSLPRPMGTSEAAITTGGKFVVVRPAVPRNNLYQIVGEPKGIQVVSLADSTERELQTRSTVVSWKLLPRSSQVIVSTNTGLRVFAIDGAMVWEQKFGGPTNFLVAPNEQSFVVGTPTGKLLWLKWNGEITQEVDLLPYNRVQDLERYVRDYTRTPGDIPHIDPAPQALPRIDSRGKGVVSFSKNLLAPHSELSDTKPLLLQSGKEVRWTAQVKPGETHVLSLMQRSAPNKNEASTGRLVVTVQVPEAKSHLYQAEIPLSALWEERTLGWRMPAKCESVEIVVRTLMPAANVTESDPAHAAALLTAEIRSAGLFTLSYPSGNLLAQRVPAAPGELPAANLDAKESALGEQDGSRSARTPPGIRYQIPNDVDLTALARGAPPFQRTLEFTTPFDGVLAGQKTSWLGKPLAGSTHATLEVKFASPVALGSLIVYEDPTDASHYTDTYALFVREAKSGRMVQVGNVIGNRSPFNLFTFPKLEVESITYLWLKSGDGHARLAELEGYLAEDDLLE